MPNRLCKIGASSIRGNQSKGGLFVAKKTGKTTAQVLEHHIQALVSRDVDSIMEDYADDAILFSPTGALKGTKNIRASFIGVVGTLTPEIIRSMKVIKQDIDGEYAYIFWSAAPSIPLGSDTFCVRDGKIVMQSFVAQTGK
jgi:ketosteroid isomerase-like protein